VPPGQAAYVKGVVQRVETAMGELQRMSAEWAPSFARFNALPPRHPDAPGLAENLIRHLEGERAQCETVLHYIDAAIETVQNLGGNQSAVIQEYNSVAESIRKAQQDAKDDIQRLRPFTGRG
jgi:hypothetical protein